MATVNLWKNVAVAMQSAITAGTSISSLTKANPGVATTGSAHGWSTGDYVLLSTQGMYQVNNRVVRLSGASGSTFNLEGIDTTNFDTFTSGTAYKITFGTTISTATSMSASGGTFDFIDTTTIHVNQKSQVPGLPNPVTYSFDNLWDPGDAGQIAMKTASDGSAQRAFKFTFSSGAVVVFSGYVGFSGSPTGSAQDKVVSPAVITQFGTLTNYSS